jgi:hypothetical protein
MVCISVSVSVAISGNRNVGRFRYRLNLDFGRSLLMSRAPQYQPVDIFYYKIVHGLQSCYSSFTELEGVVKVQTNGTLLVFSRACVSHAKLLSKRIFGLAKGPPSARLTSARRPELWNFYGDDAKHVIQKYFYRQKWN